MKPSKFAQFMLETQRPGQDQIQRRYFKTPSQMAVAITGLIADHFVGHIEPYKADAENQQWLVDEEALALISGKPVPEQQQLCAQLSDLFKQLAKEKQMLSTEQLEECQALIQSFLEMEGLGLSSDIQLPSFLLRLGEELENWEHAPERDNWAVGGRVLPGTYKNNPIILGTSSSSLRIEDTPLSVDPDDFDFQPSHVMNVLTEDQTDEQVDAYLKAPFRRDEG